MLFDLLFLIAHPLDTLYTVLGGALLLVLLDLQTGDEGEPYEPN